MVAVCSVGNGGFAPLAHELVLRHARTAPDRPALVAGDRVVRYGELAERATALAAGLAARGVGRGDRVAVLVPMSPDLYVAVVAIVSLGAIAAFVEPRSSARDIARAIGAAAPAAFIGVPRAHALRAAFAEVARVPVAIATASRGVARTVAAVALSDVEADGRGARAPRATVQPHDPALLTFSSGTTGTPKAVARSHALLAAQHAAIEHMVAPQRPREVHMTAFAIVALSGLASGHTVVIPPLGRGVDRVHRDRVARDLVARGVTVVSGSPAFLQPVVSAAPRAALATVRRVITGGAPVPVDLCERAAERLPRGASMLVVYGSTEAEPIATIDAADVCGDLAAATRAGRGLCAGRPVPQVDVRLLRPTAGPLAVGPEGLAGLCVPPGEVGEVAVAGPHVNERYWRNRDAERATKVTDERGRVWHRTGDAAYFDDRGRLWLVGRIGDAVRVGDGARYSSAVEAVARTVPGVDRAALIADRGGRPRLVVQGRRRARRPLAAALAAAGIPDAAITFARRLPVDPRHRAKLDHHAIRQRYAR